MKGMADQPVCLCRLIWVFSVVFSFFFTFLLPTILQTQIFCLHNLMILTIKRALVAQNLEG